MKHSMNFTPLNDILLSYFTIILVTNMMIMETCEVVAAILPLKVLVPYVVKILKICNFC